jgi:hypothetical protein
LATISRWLTTPHPAQRHIGGILARQQRRIARPQSTGLHRLDVLRNRLLHGGHHMLRPDGGKVGQVSVSLRKGQQRVGSHRLILLKHPAPYGDKSLAAKLRQINSARIERRLAVATAFIAMPRLAKVPAMELT